MLTRLIQRDTLGGLCLIALGLFAWWESSHYELGTLRRMGPGFLPIVISIVILGCGVMQIAGSLIGNDETVERPNLRALLAATGSVIVFALALRPLGLVIATVGLVLAVNLAGSSLPWRSLVALNIVLFAIVFGIFVLGLGMPLPLVPG
jgi:hypothetical protein